MSQSQDGTPAQPAHNVLSSAPVVSAGLETSISLSGRVLRLKPLLHVDLDVPGKSEEGFLHVDAGLGRGLHELDPVLNCQLLSSFFRNLQKYKR